MIICKNCGAELPDNAKFCTKCGYAIIPDEELRAPEEAQPAYDDWNAQAETTAQTYNTYAAAPQYQEPQYQQPQYQQPPQYYGQPYQDASYNAYRNEPQAVDTEKDSSARSAMILAIVGAALCELGIPGIIICAIARGKVKAWMEKYGTPTGMAKAANIISKVGLILSIVMTVYWLFFIIFYGVMISQLGRSYGFDIWDVFEEMFDF